VPSGVNKGAGLHAALLSLGLSAHEVVSVGSEANDHSLLDVSECAVAVADVLPALKERAAFVTRGAAEAGVAELIEALVRDELQAARTRIPHDSLLLGFDDAGNEVCIPSYGDNVLVAGPRGRTTSGWAPSASSSSRRSGCPRRSSGWPSSSCWHRTARPSGRGRGPEKNDPEKRQETPRGPNR
jgi:hypothetical protein